MQRRRLAALCLAALLLLSGCGILRDGYVSVEEHNDPYAYKEETEAPTEPATEPVLQSASNYYAILSILRAFVTGGVEHGQFRLENYRGDAEEDLRTAVDSLKNEDPVGAYALDYLECERTGDGTSWLVTANAVYRRSVSEIEAIRSVRGNDRAMELIEQTLSQLGTSLTLQISGYQEEDFPAAIRRWCMEHPNVAVQMPEISAAIYPQDGNVRVVELHLSYGFDRETLRSMQAEVDSVLNSADRYVRYAQEERVKLNLIYSYLTSRFTYAEDRENGSVYRLLCEGVGCSESFAAITAYLCRRVGLNCLIVSGTRSAAGEEDEEPAAAPYDWNLVELDGAYCHVDLQADALAGRTAPQLLYDADMTGYAWDTASYPAAGAPEEPPPEPEP